MTPQEHARAIARLDRQLEQLQERRRRLLEVEPAATCAAVLRSRASSDRGRTCGREAKHVDAHGRAFCGYHEPSELAERIARIRYEAGAGEGASR